MKKIEDIVYRLDTIPAYDRRMDGRTDGRTSCHGIVRAMHTRREVKINQAEPKIWLIFGIVRFCREFLFFVFFVIWGETRSLRMPAEACLTGWEGTSVVLRDITRLTSWCV